MFRVSLFLSGLLLFSVLTCQAQFDEDDCLPDSVKSAIYINGALANGTIIKKDLAGKTYSIQRYRDGFPHGEWFFDRMSPVFENGPTQVCSYFGTYENGRKQGTWKFDLFENQGELRVTGNYTAGIKDGKWIYDRDTGGDIYITTHIEGSYKKGQKDGVWTHHELWESGNYQPLGSYKWKETWSEGQLEKVEGSKPD